MTSLGSPLRRPFGAVASLPKGVRPVRDAFSSGHHLVVGGTAVAARIRGRPTAADGTATNAAAPDGPDFATSTGVAPCGFADEFLPGLGTVFVAWEHQADRDCQRERPC